jgi:hypothetical protein
MPKFRKKPVVIEAFPHQPGLRWPELAGDVAAGRLSYQTDGSVLIQTLEGAMRGDPGDWIIRGVKGELYPCKPDVFEASYEPATYGNVADSERLPAWAAPPRCPSCGRVGFVGLCQLCGPEVDRG